MPSRQPARRRRYEEFVSAWGSGSFAALRMTIQKCPTSRPTPFLSCGFCWSGEECHLFSPSVERVGVGAARVTLVAIVNTVFGSESLHQLGEPVAVGGRQEGFL